MKRALLSTIVLLCILTCCHTLTPLSPVVENALRGLSNYNNDISSEIESFPQSRMQENILITAYPVLFDVDSDGLLELVTPQNDTLVVYKYNSTTAMFYEFWRKRLEISRVLTYKPGPKNWTAVHKIVSSPLCADFDGDGGIEIAVISDRAIVFLRGSDGAIERVIPIDVTVLNATVVDIDLDGAIDVVMKTTKSAEPIATVNMLRNPPELGKMYEAGVPAYTIQVIPVAEFPGSQKTVLMLVYVLVDRLITAYKKGGVLYKTQITFAGKRILLQPLFGNYTGQNKSASELFLIFDDRMSLVVLPNRTIPLNITTAEILPVIQKVVNVSSISFSRLLHLPMVANFDGDSKEDLLLWFNSSVKSSTESRIDALVLIRNITYGAASAIPMIAKNMTMMKSVSIKKMLSARVNDKFCVLSLLTNGTLILIDARKNDTEFYISVQKLIDLPSTTRYLLIGDIDADGNSDLIYASNVSIGVLNLSSIINGTAAGLWACIYGSPYHQNKPILELDSDMDGLPDMRDPVPTDSDCDDDMACDYTELVLGLNVAKNDTDDDLMGDGFELIYGFDPKRNDTNLNKELDGLEDPDIDGLNNHAEWIHKTNPSKNDTDSDFIKDFDEVNGTLGFRTSPISSDTDDDGLPDKWEINKGFNPIDPTDALSDSDDDGLTLFGEYQYGTNHTVRDTDRDLMYDGYEVYYNLNPLDPNDANRDNDNDGLINLREFALGTDPTKNDTDKDKMPDGWEWRYNLNPLDPLDNVTDPDNDGLINVFEYGNKTNPRKPDTDDDGMSDLWEVIHKLSPNDPADAYGDNDFDYLINKLEYVYNTDPWNPDTDNDGLLDGLEVLKGTNPLNPDTDNDGLLDGLEVALGTNPLNPDTDNDGLTDKEEVESGTDPLSPRRDLMVPYLMLTMVLVIIVFISLPFFRSGKNRAES